MRQTKSCGAKQKARLGKRHRGFHCLGGRRRPLLCPHRPAISVAETEDSAGRRQGQDQRARHRRRGEEKPNKGRETGVGRASLNFSSITTAYTGRTSGLNERKLQILIV